MSENISIEEILKRASAKKNGSYIEEVKPSTLNHKKNTDSTNSIDKTQAVNIKVDTKTSQVDKNKEKTQAVHLDSEKTQVISQKIAAVPSKKIKEQQALSEDKTHIMPSSIPSKNKQASAKQDAQISFDDRATKKASDKTQIVDTKDVKEFDVSKTQAVTLSDSLRKDSKKSFFRKEYAEPIYSKEPPEIIEKPATIKSKSKFNKMSDLQEIPTILAVEELEKTRIMGTMAESKDDTDKDNDLTAIDAEQIKMSGFDDEIAEVSQIEETEAEAILKERRKEKVSKFRLASSADSVEEKQLHKYVKSDFRNIDEKTVITERLFAQKSAVQISLSLTTILGTIMLLLTILRDTQYLPSFLLSSNVYFITVIVVFAAIILSNINNMIHGFSLKHGINYDFPIAISAILVVIHTFLLLFNADMLIDATGVFPSAVTLGFFLSSMGKRSMLIRIIENFEFITEAGEKYTVETIENDVDATIISRGFLDDAPDIKTSIRTDFPTNFLEIGCSDEPSDKIAARTGVAMLALNIILFGVMFYITKNWQLAFNIAVCGVCISAPISSLLATNLAVLGISRTLAKKKSMVNGFEGAEMVDDAGAMILEAHDLFGPKSCDLHGIKTFNGAKIDDAILQTAAVIIKTKSPLAHVFDDVIVGKQSILPQVEDIVYEDKMGTSGWIYKKKILVGNRNLLINHNISVPKEEFENKYTKDGRKALYLAVAGKIIAMFVVSYSADPDLKRALKKLEKSGITLLVRSCDPYINEESLNSLFSLPEGFVRVINASSGRVYEKYSDMHAEKSPAYVVHGGSALGFIGAMRAAESLTETKSILSILISFGSAIGFGVVTLMSILGGYSQLTPLNVIIFQSVWTIFVLFVTKLRRFDI